MSNWDSSLVDPTAAPRDVSFIRATGGGRSGSLALENGAKFTFPWKTQQQIAGTSPAEMWVRDGADPTDPSRQRETLFIIGPDLNDTADVDRPRLRLDSWYDNGFYSTASLFGGKGHSSTGLQPRIEVGGTATRGQINLETVALTTTASTEGYITGSGWARFISTTTSAMPSSLTDWPLLVAGRNNFGTPSVATTGPAVGIGHAFVQGLTYGASAYAAGELKLNPGGGAVTVGTVDISTPLGVWTNYTPTLTQGVTVSKTTTYSRVFKLGRLVIWAFSLAPTSAGTGGSAIELSYPHTPVDTGNNPAGVAQHYNGATSEPLLSLKATGGLRFQMTNSSTGGFYSPAAINSGHSITGMVTYEATS